MAPDDDGWTIHVPSTGFQVAEVEDDGAPDAPSASQLRHAVRDAAQGATDAD